MAHANWKVIAIRLPNRLFVVNVDHEQQVAWPASPVPARLKQIGDRINRQLANLPKKLAITAGGRQESERSHNALPPSDRVWKRSGSACFR